MALNLPHPYTVSSHKTSLSPVRLAATGTTRRSKNYQQSICNKDFIQSLSSDFKEEGYVKRVEQLKPCVEDFLQQEKDDLALLELIDTLERLGLGPLFDREITAALSKINGQTKEGKNLHFTALLFRLSRQRGQMMTSDVCNSFMNEKGAFKECFSEDTQANFSFYEASYLCLEGETELDGARVFSTRNLKRHLKAGNLKENIRAKVEHALEFPYHWRLPRVEASWFINNAYTNEENMNPNLLELAKLDYNTRQARYQIEIKAASSWWSSRGVAKQLSFSRDRLADCFLVGLAITDNPQASYSREVVTLVTQFVTTIDDIYDVYGTLDELELFTDIVNRWDVHDIEKLPEYTRLCFLALFNFVNKVGYNTLREQGCNSVPFISRLVPYFDISPDSRKAQLLCDTPATPPTARTDIYASMYKSEGAEFF